MLSTKNISNKRILTCTNTTLADQMLTKKVQRKMNQEEMQLSIERLSRPLKRKTVEIADNKVNDQNYMFYMNFIEMQSGKNILNKQIPKCTKTTLTDQTHTKKVQRKMSQEEMQLSIERLSRPLKRKAVEIADNKRKVAQLKMATNTLTKKSHVQNDPRKKPLSRKSTHKNQHKNEVKKSTNKKRSTLDKKAEDSTRMDDNTTETIENGETFKETMVQGIRDLSIPVSYIRGQNKDYEPIPQYYESIAEIEDLILQYVKKNINQTYEKIMAPELQMIGLDVGKLESKIDEPKIPTDEIELNPKINEQEITIGDLKNETDEQDLKPLIIQLE
ncbi:uncharacterized protein LOC112684773, partial [Sipha flava]|uniref:Uncharacterized protein LOC112684773 n=1 Tax=Sipha flava TaxID=143950 RepID=A0A8B8FNH0_9HEMI